METVDLTKTLKIKELTERGIIWSSLGNGNVHITWTNLGIDVTEDYDYSYAEITECEAYGSNLDDILMDATCYVVDQDGGDICTCEPPNSLVDQLEMDIKTILQLNMGE